MILAFDAHYRPHGSKLVAGIFRDWQDPVPAALRSWPGGPAAAYEPGQFYRRELPLILRAVADFALDDISTIVIDGYVYLDAAGRRGLGGHLYAALQEKVPVIGVAKSYFRGTHAAAVLRGKSSKPLYVTAAGIPQTEAARLIQGMAGPYRMPDILAAVDRETKSDS